MPEVFSSSPSKHKSGTSGSQPLSAFMIEPQDVRFETQETEEKILLLMRRHPITNVAWVTLSLLMIIIPTIITPLFLGAGLFSEGVPGGYIIVLPLIWYLGVFGYAFTNFLHWYFNVYIVSTRRVVDIDWISLLYKQHSSTQLEKIQDVTYKQGGILDSFFDFGNVFIQTAGNDPNFEFEAVPRPETVVRQINQILSQHKQGVNL